MGPTRRKAIRARRRPRRRRRPRGRRRPRAPRPHQPTRPDQHGPPRNTGRLHTARRVAERAGHRRRPRSRLRAVGSVGRVARRTRTMLTAARALGNRAAEARALHQLATRELCLLGTGAAGLLTVALRIRQTIGDTMGAAATQHNIALIPPPPMPGAGPDPHRPQPQSTPRPRLRRAATAATAVVTTLAITVTIVLSNPSPEAKFTITGIDFADQPVSAPGAVETATLVNRGRTPAHIGSPRISGDAVTDFSITETTCRDELPPGDPARRRSRSLRPRKDRGPVSSPSTWTAAPISPGLPDRDGHAPDRSRRQPDGPYLSRLGTGTAVPPESP